MSIAALPTHSPDDEAHSRSFAVASCHADAATFAAAASTLILTFGFWHKFADY